MKKQTEFNFLLKSLHDLAQSKIPERSDSIVVYKTGKFWGIYQVAEYPDGGEREHKVGRDYRVKKLAVDYAYDLADRLGIDRSKVSIME